MTVRELINKLIDLDVDEPIYITRKTDNINHHIGFVGDNSIELTDYEIIDVGIHGIYRDFRNCITIRGI